MATPSPNATRLLVVDDNEDNRDMLARRLRRRGYEVETADSGAAALESIETTPFDAVLLDVMMPRISGLEVLAKVRTRFSKSELPVLMATARSDSEDVVEALRLGANDYVTKPVNLDEVISALQVALAKKG
jgi:DNA-binding response OmpR family regulator